MWVCMFVCNYWNERYLIHFAWPVGFPLEKFQYLSSSSSYGSNQSHGRLPSLLWWFRQLCARASSVSSWPQFDDWVLYCIFNIAAIFLSPAGCRVWSVSSFLGTEYGLNFVPRCDEAFPMLTEATRFYRLWVGLSSRSLFRITLRFWLFLL